MSNQVWLRTDDFIATQRIVADNYCERERNNARGEQKKKRDTFELNMREKEYARNERRKLNAYKFYM